MKKALRKLQQTLQLPSRRASLSQVRTSDQDGDEPCCLAGGCSRRSLSSEVPSALCTEQTSFSDIGAAVYRVDSSPIESPVDSRLIEHTAAQNSLYTDSRAINSSPGERLESGSSPLGRVQQTTAGSCLLQRHMTECSGSRSISAAPAPQSSASMGSVRTGLTLQARADSGNHEWGSVAESPLVASPQRLQSDVFVIAVAGGTASGKTTVCNLIMQRLHDQVVAMLPQDSFYKNLTPEQRERAKLGEYNFDSPEAIDEDLMLKCIDTLRDGRPCQLPVYDYSKHARMKTESRRVNPAQVILVEGILTLHFRSVLSRAHMKIFVDSDDDVRLARRIQRDVVERGRSMEDVLKQYARFVKPAHDDFIAPSKRIADIIIPWHKTDNLVAVDLIVGHVQSQLVKDVLLVRNQNLHLIESTFQMRGMHTIIRDQATGKGDFIFFADRLIRLVIEYALGLLPTEKVDIETPTHAPYSGERVKANVCGVSIIRSGEAMEAALRSCWKGIDIGKILVHRTQHAVAGKSTSPAKPVAHSGTPSHSSTPGHATPDSSVPAPSHSSPIAQDINGNFYRSSQAGAAQDALIYEKLPHDVADRHVLLMDPILGTGSTVARAIQVLLSRGCKQANIVFCTLIASRQGIDYVCSSFPDIKVITTEIDRAVDRNYRVVPGIGEFGDRYFCC